METNVWNEAAAGWKIWWPIIDKAGKPVSLKLAELCKLKPGDKVLDLATGPGEPALTAAQIVGEKGFVLGVDASSQMLAFAKNRTQSLNLKNIEFKECNLQTYHYESAPIDAVLCRWGLMFIQDLRPFLTHIRSILKKGGMAAFAVWSTPEKVPMMSLGMEEIQKKYGKIERPPGSPDPGKLADPLILKEALHESGFVKIQWEKMLVEYEWDSAEAFTQFRYDISPPFRTIFSGKPEEMKKEILNTLTEAARSHARQDGKLVLQNETLCFSAAH